MAVSPLQEIFLSELADTFSATQRRISKRLADVGSSDVPTGDAIIRHELRGLYHGVLVIFDGGTSLAEHGLISIVDENGNAFQRSLHEICFGYWKPDTNE